MLWTVCHLSEHQHSRQCVASLPRVLPPAAAHADGLSVIQPQSYGALCAIVFIQMLYYDRKWSKWAAVATLVVYAVAGAGWEVGMWEAMKVCLLPSGTWLTRANLVVDFQTAHRRGVKGVDQAVGILSALFLSGGFLCALLSIERGSNLTPATQADRRSTRSGEIVRWWVFRTHSWPSTRLGLWPASCPWVCSSACLPLRSTGTDSICAPGFKQKIDGIALANYSSPLPSLRPLRVS